MSDTQSIMIATPIPVIGKDRAVANAFGCEKNGVITPALNQAAATVLVNSDNVFRCDLLRRLAFMRVS